MSEEYKSHWLQAVVNIHARQVAETIANLALGYWPLYTAVKAVCGVPEYVTACIDYRESDFDHRSYLANGDPLFNSDGKPLPTRHVPKGLGPVKSWVEGAVLSLEDSGITKLLNLSSIADILYQLEAYNGLGYQKHAHMSPYLWSGTNLYTSGKYISDGIYQESFVDKQLGCVPLLRTLQFKGILIPNS